MRLGSSSLGKKNYSCEEPCQDTLSKYFSCILSEGFDFPASQKMNRSCLRLVEVD